MGIDVNILAGETESTSSIEATGSIIEPVSYKEVIDAFGSLYMLEQELSRMALLPGGVQTNFDDVTRTATADSAEIVSITSEPVIVKTQDFINNSDIKGTFNVSITDTVTNTATSTWQTGGSITVTQKISYGIDFIIKGTAETSISYTQSWGVGGSHSVSYTVGSSAGVTVEIGPKQAIRASLSASRGSLKCKVIYKSFLSGKIRVMPKQGGYMQYFEVQDVLARMKKDTTQISTEEINVGYYASSKIIIDNLDTGSQKTYAL